MKKYMKIIIGITLAIGLIFSYVGMKISTTPINSNAQEPIENITISSMQIPQFAEVNKKIDMSINANSNSGTSLLYFFAAIKGDKSIIIDNSKNSNVYWVPSEVGEYTIYVEIGDNVGGTIVKQYPISVLSTENYEKKIAEGTSITISTATQSTNGTISTNISTGTDVAATDTKGPEVKSFDNSGIFIVILMSIISGVGLVISGYKKSLI